MVNRSFQLFLKKLKGYPSVPELKKFDKKATGTGLFVQSFASDFYYLNYVPNTSFLFLN